MFTTDLANVFRLASLLAMLEYLIEPSFLWTKSKQNLKVGFEKNKFFKLFTHIPSTNRQDGLQLFVLLFERIKATERVFTIVVRQIIP